VGRRPAEPDLSTLRGRIGASIRKHRIRADLTQPELARMLRERGHYASRSSVSYWEVGKKMPPIDALYELASIFRLSIRELLPRK
jgi:transcriptional regulator with XRE-family HTH domain